LLNAGSVWTLNASRSVPSALSMSMGETEM
jgi:hypothetical protein